MEKNDMLGSVTLYGGAISTSCAAPAAYTTESAMLLIFSALGASSAVFGLIYTVWNGNRNFKLQQQAIELNLAVRGLREVAKEQVNG